MVLLSHMTEVFRDNPDAVDGLAREIVIMREGPVLAGNSLPLTTRVEVEAGERIKRLLDVTWLVILK